MHLSLKEDYFDDDIHLLHCVFFFSRHLPDRCSLICSEHSTKTFHVMSKVHVSAQTLCGQLDI